MAKSGWHRPYDAGIGVLVVGTPICVVIGLAQIALATIILSGWREDPSLILPACFVLGVGCFVAGGSLRFVIVGVWVSPAGVRLRTVFRTRQIGWSEIAGFEYAPNRWGVSVACIRLHDGSLVPTTGVASGEALGRWIGDPPLVRVRKLEEARERFTSPSSTL